VIERLEHRPCALELGGATSAFSDVRAKGGNPKADVAVEKEIDFVGK
jgi:hypothetical protein